MTVVETQEASPSEVRTRVRPSGTSWKKYVAFGSSVGIEICETELVLAIVHVRPNGPVLEANARIPDFRNRPAAEWGAEFHQFLRKHGETHLAATILLPRREVIVRQIWLPGVAPRDVASAIALQLDSLHPYGDEQVAYGCSRGQSGAMLVGVLRQAALDHYAALFAEAGIPVAAFTFSAAAIYAALRVFGTPPSEFLTVVVDRDGVTEIYGESAARPVFSAEFDLPMERAASLARGELRLSPDTAAADLLSVLPAPRNSKTAEDALVFASALAGACPWVSQVANLLPPERRTWNSRALYIPTIALAALLLLTGIAVLAYSSFKNRQYLDSLHAEIARWQPVANRAATLDRTVEAHRARIRLLDNYRKRSQADLDVLNELTQLLQPPAWVSLIELYPDSIVITGEADQAGQLLQVLDKSPYFRNSEFASSVIKTAKGEQFRIKTYRRTRP